MKCENCEHEHDGSYGSGRFCSSTCARGFSTKTKRKEINEKVSKSRKGQGPAHNGNYDKDAWRQKYQATLKEKREEIKGTHPFEQWPAEWRRELVFEAQNGCCNKCGLDTWLNEIIPLELEHKDGNNTNDVRENLEFLCPNCHALTSTWRGRNKSNTGKTKVSDDELLEALKSSQSIRQALMQVGLSPKGNNYLRAKKILGRSPNGYGT